MILEITTNKIASTKSAKKARHPLACDLGSSTDRYELGLVRRLSGCETKSDLEFLFTSEEC